MKKNTKWTIDSANSKIAFSIKHLMIAIVRGTFEKFSGIIYSTDYDFTKSEIDVRIDPASINTGDPKRNFELKTNVFFNVAVFNEMVFTSHQISPPNEKGNHEMSGELTIKGITKTVSLNVEFGEIIYDLDGNETARFKVYGIINRKDWELDWNSALQVGGELIGEDVNISCEIMLVKSNSIVAKLETSKAQK